MVSRGLRTSLMSTMTEFLYLLMRTTRLQSHRVLA